MLVQMLVPVSGELARIKPAVHRLKLGPREDVTFFISIKRSKGGVFRVFSRFRPEKIVQYTSNIMQTEGKKTARILEPRRYFSNGANCKIASKPFTVFVLKVAQYAKGIWQIDST